MFRAVTILLPLSTITVTGSSIYALGQLCQFYSLILPAAFAAGYTWAFIFSWSMMLGIRQHEPDLILSIKAFRKDRDLELWVVDLSKSMWGGVGNFWKDMSFSRFTLMLYLLFIALALLVSTLYPLALLIHLNHLFFRAFDRFLTKRVKATKLSALFHIAGQLYFLALPAALGAGLLIDSVLGLI